LRRRFRFICCCRDCQAFAHFLERLGVLDEAGGTDIYQMPAGRVKLTAGTDAVRCLHFCNKSFAGTPIVAGPRSATRPVRVSRLLVSFILS
jgi:hypothetical protein